MTKKIFLSLVVAFAFANAMATDLPKYYPKDGFQFTGRIDAVYAEERRIVIGDISYLMSPSVVVHTLTSEDSSMGRIRLGLLVGFRLGSGRMIEEIWVLPSDYERTKRR